MALKQSQKKARVTLAVEAINRLRDKHVLPRACPCRGLGRTAHTAAEEKDTKWQKAWVDRLLERKVVQTTNLYANGSKTDDGIAGADIYIISEILLDYEMHDGIYILSLLFPTETGGVRLPDPEEAINDHVRHVDELQSDRMEKQLQAATDEQKSEAGGQDKLIELLSSIAGYQLHSNRAYGETVKSLDALVAAAMEAKQILKSIPGAVSELIASVAKLSGELDKRVGGTNRRLDDLDKRMAELTRQIQGRLQQPVIPSQPSVLAALDSIDHRVQEQAGLITSLSTTVSSILDGVKSSRSEKFSLIARDMEALTLRMLEETDPDGESNVSEGET